jgi:hypothetical protein
MSNKFMESCPKSLVIREMQINVRKLAKGKKMFIIPSVTESVGKNEHISREGCELLLLWKIICIF